jgi:hypothetical protein
MSTITGRRCYAARTSPGCSPARTAGTRGLKSLGEQITDAVEDRVGIRVTPHQYRHAAAALIMRATQDYEFARRVSP